MWRGDAAQERSLRQVLRLHQQRPARTPANCCATASRRRPRWTRCRCPSFSARRWTTPTCCVTAPAGLFLAASKFPKNRETRPPFVMEILPHRKEIDPKYDYLMDAPEKDPEGNPTVIRYSRKSKEAGDAAGRTGWQGHRLVRLVRKRPLGASGQEEVILRTLTDSHGQ